MLKGCTGIGFKSISLEIYCSHLRLNRLHTSNWIVFSHIQESLVFEVADDILVLKNLQMCAFSLHIRIPLLLTRIAQCKHFLYISIHSYCAYDEDQNGLQCRVNALYTSPGLCHWSIYTWARNTGVCCVWLCPDFQY